MTVRRNRAIAAGISVTAAGLAIAALSSGLDRMGRSDPRAAAAVPKVVRHQAWRGVGEAALIHGRINAAGMAAEDAVLFDPADPAAVSLLGLARLASGDAAGADAAFRVSGSLGWRDLPTQMYWLNAAPLAGADVVAAERADAILRQNAILLERPQFLAELESTPAGRRALADRLASRPAWFSDYWNRTFTLPPDRLTQRAAVLAEPALRRAKISCGEVRALATRLGENGNASASRAIIKRFCGA